MTENHATQPARTLTQMFDEMVEQCQGWKSTDARCREWHTVEVKYDAHYAIWIVSFDANEWSSGYHEWGVGKTLAEAITAMTDDPAVHRYWSIQYPGI